jgi:hypothetical protein
MAEQTTITTREETPEAFLADRQRFWTMFTQFTFFAVAAVIILLILLWWFLL